LENIFLSVFFFFFFVCLFVCLFVFLHGKMQVLAMLSLFFLFIACASSAASFTAKYVCPTPSTCFGYWEYLPASYNPATADKHPTIVTLHGSGEGGMFYLV
jgi:hypothetical protein